MLHFRSRGNIYLDIPLPRNSVLLLNQLGSVRPGDERFRKSPQRGQRGDRNDHICHQTSDRQYRSHAFIRAISTKGKSALACRTRSSARFAYGKTWRQVSGTRDLAVGVVNCFYRISVITCLNLNRAVSALLALLTLMSCGCASVSLHDGCGWSL